VNYSFQIREKHEVWDVKKNVTIVTPRGFRDVLPGEADWREALKARAMEAIALWGYEPVETPTLEVLEVLELGGQLGKAPFKLFDSDGKLLVLRPDVTIPVARMVASRLATSKGPFRLRYCQPVFREEETHKGQSREFTQIGVEFIGEQGAASDAEVILLLIDALKACGLKEFTVAICTVGVLRELLQYLVEKAGASEDWRRAVLSACHRHNLVEIETLTKNSQIDGHLQSVLLRLLSIRGGKAAIQQCRDLVEEIGCSDGLDELARTYEIIEALGLSEFVSVDFSVMSAFDYYTGLVLEAYAPRIGTVLGGGGRYDNMTEAFGRKAPAAGFAFNLDRVMMALLEQGARSEDVLSMPACKTVVVDDKTPADAFIKAAKMREFGTAVRLVSPDRKERR